VAGTDDGTAGFVGELVGGGEELVKVGGVELALGDAEHAEGVVHEVDHVQEAHPLVRLRVEHGHRQDLVLHQRLQITIN
jgi:hypothetical protein